MSDLESKQGRWGNDHRGLMIKSWDLLVVDQDEVEVAEQGRWRVKNEVKGQDISMRILNWS